MFVGAYLPFAENGSGVLLCVDTRGWEAADGFDRVSASFAHYVDSVRSSIESGTIESGTEHSGLLPTVENGAPSWKVDYSHRSQRVTQPEPTVGRNPFPLTSFLPSQISPEDDLINLEVVRRPVINTAQALTSRRNH